MRHYGPGYRVYYKDAGREIIILLCGGDKATQQEDIAKAKQIAVSPLEDFGKKWNEKYPMIYQSWDRRWDDLSEFFKYPPEIRRAIYTTNAIESLNYQLRKVSIRQNNHFYRLIGN